MAAVIGVTGLAFEARIAADWYTHAICSGDGSTLAGALASAIAGDCRGLMSFGVAGGLSPDLPGGTCIVGSTIVSETIQFTTDRNWSQALLRLIPDAIHGAIAGVTTTMAHPEAKRSLHTSTGALAVDNESHVVASVSAARGLPMAAVRVIMDPANRELPADRFGYGACKRDDRPRRVNPRDNEAAWRITDAAGRTDRIRCAASLPSIARPGLRTTFLA